MNADEFTPFEPDAAPPGFDPAVFARGQLRARLLNEEEQHNIGLNVGFELGHAAAYREMAEWFALVARLVRQRAGHPSYAERAAAEAEWIKPKPGDYTGQLTAAEYFATESPQLTSLERRAA